MHWLATFCFIVLALTGLNITFGKELLLPLIGPREFDHHFGSLGKLCPQLPEPPFPHQRAAYDPPVDLLEFAEPARP